MNSTAKAILEEIKRRNANFKPSYRENRPFPEISLCDRKLEITPESICYGIAGRMHAHGIFPLSHITEAADFLLHPNKMPPSVEQIVTVIVAGVKEPCDLDATDVLKPKIRTKYGYVQIGLYSSLTINFYYPDKEPFGLVDKDRAIEFLNGQ